MSHAFSSRVAAAAPRKCGVRRQQQQQQQQQQQRLASARSSSTARASTARAVDALAAESAKASSSSSSFSTPTSTSSPPSSSSSSAAAAREPAASAAAALAAANGSFSRRDALFSAAALSAALAAAALPPPAARAADAAAVGTYLPKSAALDGFSHYQPSSSETPSIRAGVIKPDPGRGLYSFDLPSTWRPQKIANALTGNFCMPRCDEPWTECVFAGAAEGSVKVVVSPLRRLTNRASVAISDVGPPAAIISSLGSFVTGNQPPEEEEVVRASKEDGVSGPVYTYEINAPYGLTGPHHLVSVTTRADLAYIFVVSATEKQWAKAKGTLEKVAGSFQA